jgi:hypothetical protein
MSIVNRVCPRIRVNMFQTHMKPGPATANDYMYVLAVCGAYCALCTLLALVAINIVTKF